jgi:hypothetical protein
MFHREVKDFSVYSWLFVTAGFYPVSTDDLLEANVRFCLGAPGRKANIQANRPTLSLGEVQPLFWNVCSNGVEPKAGPPQD